MNSRFDEVIDRSNYLSVKVDMKADIHVPEDALPMWVADMDFRSPDGVQEALGQIVERGIYGYSNCKKEYFDVLSDWYARHYGWQLREEWLVRTPSVVYALFAAVKALTAPGEAVMILRPVYGPFTRCVEKTGRRLVTHALHIRDGHYEMDFEALERQIAEEQVRLLLFCNPHNPGGRVWTREELERLGAICLAHGVKIVADEIHQDFIYPGHTFTCLASISPALADITVTCTSPSKTFNLAGLQISNIWIPNGEMRAAFREVVAQTGYDGPGLMGLAAAMAAYATGEQWLVDLRAYLWENIQYVKNCVENHAPKIRLMIPEGTYLLWMDFSAYGLSEKELDRKMKEEAKLWLNAGDAFGSEGAGWMRMNIACPRATVEEGCRRLISVFGEQ